MGRVGRTVSSINQAVKYVEASQPGEVEYYKENPQ